MITNVLDKIVSYELGEMSEKEEIELFQELVDTGVIWSLQGSYQRRAKEMIYNGIIEGND